MSIKVMIMTELLSLLIHCALKPSSECSFIDFPSFFSLRLEEKMKVLIVFQIQPHSREAMGHAGITTEFFVSRITLCCVVSLL